MARLIPRRKLAPLTYNLRRRTHRDVAAVHETLTRDQSRNSNVDHASQPCSSAAGHWPSNHSAKTLDVHVGADSIPARSVPDMPHAKWYRHRASSNRSNHMPNPDIRKCTKKQRNAPEAEKIDRRRSGRLLAIKRSGEMNEAAQHAADTINTQSTRIRGSSSFMKRRSIFASPTSFCFKPKGLLNTSGNVSAPRHHPTCETKPKAWTRIYKNRLVGDAKRYWKKPKIEKSLCICTVPVPGSLEPGCGERCLNRVMDYECDPDNCGLGDLCTNRDFARLAIRLERTKNADERSKCDPSSIGVELFKTSDRGFGVRACTQFEPHQIIVELTGEIITPTEAGRRTKEDYKNKADFYQITFDRGMILDATKGSIARFVNHSCEPNCKMLKRFVKGQPRMALFAGDYGILTGQELTYDYNFNPYSTEDVQECRCGSSNCRGILGPRPKDNKKPIDKTGKGRVAHGKKRKIGGPTSTALAAKVVNKLSEKRKVPPMPKGWVYIDKGMEKIRIEEARKDKEIAWLQKEGILPATFQSKQPKTRTCSSGGKGKAI